MQEKCLIYIEKILKVADFFLNLVKFLLNPPILFLVDKRGCKIAQLNKYASSKQPEFVALYGRRRVGKTFLINKTLGEQMVFETSGVLMGEQT